MCIKKFLPYILLSFMFFLTCRWLDNSFSNIYVITLHDLSGIFIFISKSLNVNICITTIINHINI